MLEVFFTPWIEEIDALRVGSFEIRSFRRRKESRIPDKRIPDHLSECFNSHVDYTSKPVSTITVCSHSRGGFEPLSELEYTELRQVVVVIA